MEFVNPIKDLVVRGIRLVRTSQTEYKIEKKRRTDNLTEASAVDHRVSLEEMGTSADVNKDDGPANEEF